MKKYQPIIEGILMWIGVMSILISILYALIQNLMSYGN